VTTPLPSTRARLAALALAVALVPFAAGTADAAYKPHHRHTEVTKKRAVTARHAAAKRAAAKPAAAKPAATPAPAPAVTPAPAPTSVISIGGYVFYNLTYAQAVEAYQAALAAGGPAPAPVTSVSVTTTVGSAG
jgi:hypothetical protein